MPKKPSVRVNGNAGTAKRQSRPWSRDWHDFDPSQIEGDQTLVEELTTYRDHLDELLERPGDYVLIKGKQVIGIFADRQEAIVKAYELFEGEPALVKKIVEKEPLYTLGGVIF